MAPRRESGVPSARTVLEVADGLRWTDPALGVSLAEHALRAAGDDAAARTAAERSVIRSLAELDRFDEVVSRATPLVDDAQVRGDREDLAGLLVELAVAAIGLGDLAVAGRLVEPMPAGGDLSARTVTLAALVRAQVAAANGDVSGADRAAEDAGTALLRTPEPEAGLVRRDLARARAAARRRATQAAAALSIVSEAVSARPEADADGGRRSLLAAADEVDLLLDLDRRDEALERGRAVLPDGPAGPVAVGATARIRLALAERVHLATGAPADAEAMARAAATELEAAGHDGDAARAWEVVAAAAERGGQLGPALTAVRHGHDLDSRARDRRDPALRVLTMIAAAAPDLPVVTPAPSPSRPPEPGPTPEASAFSEVESLLADARSSLGGGVNGSEPLPRRRGHRRDDADDDVSTPEQVPEALARLLGAAGLTSGLPADGSSAPSANGTGEGRRGGTDVGGNGNLPCFLDPGTPSSADPLPPEPGRRSRHSAEPWEEPVVDPAVAAAGEVSRPTFDAFSTAPGRRAANGVSDSDHGLPGPEPGAGSASGSDAAGPTTERWSAGHDGASPGLGAEDRFLSVEPPTPGDPGLSSSLTGGWGYADELAGSLDIDPADPLGSGSGWGVTVDRPDESARSNGSAPGAADAAPAEAPASRNGSLEPLEASGTRRPDTGSRSPGGGAGDAEDHESVAHAPGSGPRAQEDEPRVVPPGFDPEDLYDELPLTLAGLLAEYHLPDVPVPPRRNGARRTDVAVPSARTHVSGSMPVPADPRFAARPDAAPSGGSATPPADGPVQGPPRRGENGARLADLLAEAMDAFRHTGPGDGSRGGGDGAARGPGVGSRRG
ncbi:hypothetical protein LQ327_33455 [Actinomycetospora endophytica]|uniref:Syndecan 1 n=1 Tax=Actinomycetospora endophytica TaxID=2291215 RepID=A0ABS8PJ54_9PSEU|nr:hypothetical protein [Actinomycetospora endophytica]MCD2198284.1 hypothetical protein [Actinomycetospora endophytica]